MFSVMTENGTYSNAAPAALSYTRASFRSLLSASACARCLYLDVFLRRAVAVGAAGIPARVAHMFSGLEKRSLSAIFFGRVRMDYAPSVQRSPPAYIATRFPPYCRRSGPRCIKRRSSWLLVVGSLYFPPP